MIKAVYPEVDFSDIARSPFDYVAMGHYHNKVVRRSGRRVFAYSGSTEVVETREVPIAVREGKFILSLEIDRDGIEIKELRLKTRPFLYFSESVRNTRELYNLIERLMEEASSLQRKPVVVGSLQVTGELRAGFSTVEVRRALSDLALYVNIRELRKLEEAPEESEVVTGIGLEELVQNAISSMKLGDEVRSLSLKVFDLWYKEGKRGEVFVREVLKLAEGES